MISSSPLTMSKNGMIEECLPSLLLARRAKTGCAMQMSGNVVPLEIADEVIARSTTLAEPAYSIKNTFIADEVPCSPSLAGFYQAREVRSCPSDRIGCLSNCFDIASISTETPVDTPRVPQAVPPSPCLLSTPTADDVQGDMWQTMAAPVNSQWPMNPAVGSEMDYAYQYVPEGHYEDGWVSFTPFPEAGQRRPLVPHEVPMAPCSRERVATVVCLADLIQDTGSFKENSNSPVRGASPAVAEDVVSPPPADDARSALLEIMNRSATCTPPAPPPGPAPGSEELPSVGSSGHGDGSCKPCAFFHTKGCEKGPACVFCHACPPEARKERRRDKMESRQAARLAKKAAARSRQ